MSATEERLVDQIKKMDDRIAAAKVQMTDRDKTKDVALGTSKINYIVSRSQYTWLASLISRIRESQWLGQRSMKSHSKSCSRKL